MINSWLSGRTQQVVLDGQASDLVPVLSGVPQGSILGPVLFLIFINDLPDNIRSSVRLFADDCVLYRNIHSLQDCLILHEDFTSLGQWEADWQMKFNVAKCYSMRVTRHQHHKQMFLCVFCVFFILQKIQIFAHPGVMLKSERSQYDRKKEESTVLKSGVRQILKKPCKHGGCEISEGDQDTA